MRPAEHLNPALEGNLRSYPSNMYITRWEGETRNEAVESVGLTYHQRNTIVVAILAFLIFLLILALLYLVYPPLYHWWSRRYRSKKKEESCPDRRYETIEGWLISKRVRVHDKCCAKIQKQFCRRYGPGSNLGSPKSLQGSESHDSVETPNTECRGVDEERGEGGKECAICMELFSIDDVVSWSPNIDASCRHVFHHECIKEWLLQSGHCPCCREFILPFDEDGFSLDRVTLKELCRKRAELAATSFYCHVDGMVCFANPKRVSRSMVEILKSATCCGITRADLTNRRGHRVTTDKDATFASDTEASSTADNMVESVTVVVDDGEQMSNQIRNKELTENNDIDSATTTLLSDRSQHGPDPIELNVPQDDVSV